MPECKMVIIARTDLAMGKGKLAAQCAHAAIEAYIKAEREEPKWVQEWKETGQAKIVLKVGSEKELLDYYNRLKKNFPTSLIKDAGRTQIEPGSITCIAAGPAPEDRLNTITKELKLL